jgi:hypothetical protein
MECASSACAFEGGSRAAALQIQPCFPAHLARMPAEILLKTKFCMFVLQISRIFTFLIGEICVIRGVFPLL